MKGRLILGVDPGTQITGYSVIHAEKKKREVIAWGVIKLGRISNDQLQSEKLKKIHDRITSIIQDFQPGELAIESPFVGKNMMGAIKLGRAQGVVLAAAIQNGLDIYEYAPRKVKMAVTGRGNASKDQVATMVQSILTDLDTSEKMPFDAYDALAVAICHSYQNEINQGTAFKSWDAYLKSNPDKLVQR